jgi:predicted amidophosphoribosyltransferase
VLSLLSEYSFDIYRLFYPRICGGCDVPLAKGENYLCLHCRLGLPYTCFEDMKDNPVERVFTGRAAIEFATAFLFFTKGEKVQQMMHNIKYNDHKELAVYLGQLFGERLNNNIHLKDVSVLVPVPLHPQKTVFARLQPE